MRAIRVLVACGLVVVSGACGGSDDGGNATSGDAAAASAEKRTLEIEATEFGFSLPDTVPAGVYETQLTNVGKELHQALIYKLNDDVSFDEFMDAVKKDDSNLPGLASSAGGHPKIVGAGETNTYGNDELEPGDYAVLCFVRDFKTSKQHSELGMITPFTVE